MSAVDQLGVSSSLAWALTFGERGLPCFPCRVSWLLSHEVAP
jgi:hypothetical protein